MRIAQNILLIVLAVFLQTSWGHTVSIAGISPDFVLLVLVYIGITGGQIEATVFGFCSGFLIDIYAPETLGINTLSNAVVGFAVGFFRVGVVAEDLQVQALILFLATLLHDFIFFTIYSISEPLNIFFLFLRYGLGTAVYTTVLGISLSLVMARIFHKRIVPDAR